MLINIPNELTNEEEQLLKKIAKMTKKKKNFMEKKSAKEAHVETPASQVASTAQTPTAQKKASITATTSLSSGGSEVKLDAKEAAKKLIQSGAIKLEPESKDKGFKRSSSRKDKDLRDLSPFESKRPSQDFTGMSPQISPSFNSNNRFQFNEQQGGPNRGGYTPRSANPTFGKSFRGNFQRNFSQTGPGGAAGSGSPTPRSNWNNNGVALFVKANNVTEDLLRSLISSNVSEAKIISIDIKTNFAFVHVDTKEAAESVINELNGKTFQDSLFSVSLARPKNRPMNRNPSYNNYERSNSFNSGGGGFQNEPPVNRMPHYSNTPPAHHHQSPNPYNQYSNSGNSNTSSPNSGTESASPASSSRQMINYEDI